MSENINADRTDRIDETNKIRRIGILTSGGDAPGMNAAIRAVTRSAISRGIRAIGILKGYRGLIDGELIEYNARAVSNIINRGGTVLYSDRCAEFLTEEGQKKAADTCREFEIDGVVAIGGDGTFRGAMDLSRQGIPTIGLPGTIDNDITATDYSIGFDTAMNTVVEMVDRLRDTCESHARCNVVEVMGRNAGHIALQCGIAVGAAAIAVSEISFDEDECINKIVEGRKNKKRNFIIIVSEGMGSDYAENLVKRITEKTGFDTRFARLAHVQRGGSPTLRDRFAATVMGDKAVELILAGKTNRVVCMQEDKIVDVGIEYALNLDKRFKGKMTDEDFGKLSGSDQKSISEHIKRKQANFRDLYEIAKRMSI